MNYALKLSKKLSFGEEIANAVTHAVGAVLMLILLPISAIYSYEEHGLVAAVGTSIFVISLFLMFLSSTVYHWLNPQVYLAHYRPLYDLHRHRWQLHACRAVTDE